MFALQIRGWREDQEGPPPAIVSETRVFLDGHPDSWVATDMNDVLTHVLTALRQLPEE